MSTSSRRPRPHRDAAAEIAVLVVAVAAVVMGLVAALRGLGPLPLPTIVLCVAILLIAPVIHRELTSRLGKIRHARLWSGGAALALTCAVGYMGREHGGIAVLVGLVMGVVWLASTPGRTAESVLVLTTATAVALVALLAYPDRVTLISLLVVSFLVAVATLFVHGRDVRRGALESRGAVVVQEHGARLSGRIGFGVLLAGAVVLCVPICFRTELLIAGAIGVDVGSTPVVEEPPFVPPPWPTDVTRRSAHRPSEIVASFPTTLPAGKKDPDQPNQPIMDVWIERGGAPDRSGRSFLLRGLAFGDVRIEGVRAVASNDRWRSEDGSIAIQSGRTGDLEIRIRQAPIAFEGGRTFLASFESAHGIRFERPASEVEVMAPYEGCLTLNETVTQWLDYRLEMSAARFDGANVRTSEKHAFLGHARARHPDAIHVETPGEWEYLGRVRQQAGDIASPARTDAEVVARVVEHLRQYRYDANKYFSSDLAAVEVVLEERVGLCSHFAMAATTLLRSLSIPTRVATGYLVSAFDPTNDQYVVWESDRHCWIEVHFEGYGWVPFDPTPPAVVNAHRALRGDEPISSGHASDSAEDDHDDHDDPDDHDDHDGPVTLSAVLDDLGALPGRIARELRSLPLWLGAMAGVLVWWTWSRPRRSTARTTEARVAEDPRYRRLLTALERTGSRKRRAQTAREFARLVVSEESSRSGDVRRAIDLFYQAWFGQKPLTDEDLGFIDRVTDELERGRPATVRRAERTKVES